MSIFGKLIRAVTGGAEAVTSQADATKGVATAELRQSLRKAVHEKAMEFQGSAFPYTTVRVRVRAPEEDTRARYHHAIFHEEPPFAEAVRLTLKDAGFDLPASLQVTPELLPEWPEGSGLSPEARIAVDFQGGITTRGGGAAASGASLVLRVVRGKAEQEVYPLTGQTLQIGRGARHRLSGGAVRQNTVAFLQPGDADLTPEETAINQRVGRAHASIVFDPSVGLYRLVCDGTATLMHCRGEIRLEVASRHQRVYLHAGDVIELGSDATIAVETAG
ncbi:MAG: hypothetical protein AAFQ43_06305 [Bacteroidota bacterium]